jgi:hypothetical protein
MQILVTTLIAHIVFTLSDAYWLFSWLDMSVHLFVGMGIGIIFVKNFKWGSAVSIVAICLIAIGWEYAERIIGLAQAIAETYADALSDVCFGIIGGIIGSNYAKRNKYK